MTENRPNYSFNLNGYQSMEEWDWVDYVRVHVVDTNDENYHPELGDGHWTDVDSFLMPYHDYCNFSHEEIAQVWRNELVNRANASNLDVEETLARYGFTQWTN